MTVVALMSHGLIEIDMIDCKIVLACRMLPIAHCQLMDNIVSRSPVSVA